MDGVAPNWIPACNLSSPNNVSYMSSSSNLQMYSASLLLKNNRWLPDGYRRMSWHP